MTVKEKAKEIQKYYGTDYIHGKKITDMSANQVHAIFDSMQNRGDFEKYEAKKEAYIALFPGQHYTARMRAENLSFFELDAVIPKVVKDKTGNYPEGYQYTLFDEDILLIDEKGVVTDGNSTET